MWLTQSLSVAGTQSSNSGPTVSLPRDSDCCLLGPREDGDGGTHALVPRAHGTSTSSRFTGLRPCLLAVVATGKVLLLHCGSDAATWLEHPHPITTWERWRCRWRASGARARYPCPPSYWLEVGPGVGPFPSLGHCFCIFHEGVDVHPSQGYVRDPETTRFVGGLREA